MRVKRGPNCWEWNGGHSGGYPLLTIGRKHRRRAHRVAYTLFIGAIPTGHDIHHTCNNPGCVNPAHLQALTRREHVRLTSQTVTHCPRGHEYTEANTQYHMNGRRRCAECNRQRNRAYYQRKKQP